jgi:hypothetical protein
MLNYLKFALVLITNTLTLNRLHGSEFRPLTPATGVQIPLGTPDKNKKDL